MSEPMSDHIFGANSYSWLRKAALFNVPQQMLWFGVTRMLDYWDYSAEPDPDTAIEVLMQFALNGKYVPTREHDCDEHNDYPNAYSYLDPTLPRDAAAPPVPTVDPLPTEEQERIIREFNEMMGHIPEADQEGEKDE